MRIKLIRAAMVMLVAAILVGCENKSGDNTGDSAQATNAPEAEASTPNQPEADSAKTTPSRAYAPDGLDGATVTVRPVGKALISIVDGNPVRIFEEAANDEYSQVRLLPGDHVLHVRTVDARQGLNLNFRAGGGEYFALALTYTVAGELFWTPVIVSGGPTGPIVADKDGLLGGKTLAEAVKLLAANQGATLQEEAKKKKSEKEARRKLAEKEAAAKAQTMFAKAVKATEAKQLEEALQTLDEILKIGPNFDSALILKGVVLGRLKKPEAALESLEKGIGIGQKIRGADDESLHWAWMEKGKILIATRQPDEAQDAFSEAIRIKPTATALSARANLNFSRGQILGKKKDWDGAEPFFKSALSDAEKGIELDPKSANFWSIKIGTHIMLNENEQACLAMRKTCELGNCSFLEQYPQCKPGGS